MYINVMTHDFHSFRWKCNIPNIHQMDKLSFSVSRGANSNWDFGLVWVCTEEFEFLDLEDFGSVAFSVVTVILVNSQRDPQLHVCVGYCTILSRFHSLTHTQARTHIHTHTLTHIHTHIQYYLPISKEIHSCMCGQVRTSVTVAFTHTHTHTRTYTRTHIHTHTHTLIHKRTHVHSYTHRHRHRHIHTDMTTCQFPKRSTATRAHTHTLSLTHTHTQHTYDHLLIRKEIHSYMRGLVRNSVTVPTIHPHKHAHTHTHTRTHTHTHTHTHITTCQFPKRSTAACVGWCAILSRYHSARWTVVMPPSCPVPSGVSMYIWACIHIYVFIQICIYVHTYIHMIPLLPLYVYTYIHIHVYIWIYTNWYICIYVYTYDPVPFGVLVYMIYKDVYIYMCICTYTTYVVHI